MKPYIQVKVDFSTISDQGFTLLPSSIDNELLHQSQRLVLTSDDATAFARVESILSQNGNSVALCKVDAFIKDESKDEENRYAKLVAHEMLANLAHPDRYSAPTRKAAIVALRDWDRDHGILSY